MSTHRHHFSSKIHKASMTEKEFDSYWTAHKTQILNSDSTYQKAKANYKTTGGADLLLYAIPVITGILTMEYCTLHRELLRWLLCAVVVIVSFVVCVWVKSLITDSLPPEAVENKIRQRLHDEMVEN